MLLVLCGALAHRRRKVLRVHVYDLLRMAVIVISYYVLSTIQLSRVYHYIRGEAIIKLYVIFNILEVCVIMYLWRCHVPFIAVSMLYASCCGMTHCFVTNCRYLTSCAALWVKTSWTHFTAPFAMILAPSPWHSCFTSCLLLATCWSTRWCFLWS